ncbi:protein phosphatase 1 regulatory subunit 36 isoform X2 [Rhinatrema bivittatum]|uniref:protein phosphatase 1 regulatory subunit 36 isoform X2 n=1 Tax=Rhinatrema bivittatum TaxID=194408 RepID=UPI0011268ADC|nr:protein phosphatase 1 regulatory subunit 36 isoform X2 [Rhinatrema bivittatum]
MEGLTKPTTGQWYWRDDSKTLEFQSYDGTIDGKDKHRKSKVIHFQELGSTLADSSENKLHSGLRSSMGILKTTRPLDGTFSALTQKSNRSSLKRDHDVALYLLQEGDMYDMHQSGSFSSIVRSQQLDDFFMALLFYLSCYLNRNSLDMDRISLANKHKSLGAKGSATDRKELAAAVHKEELAQKHLAHMYGILVLGVEMPAQHHMACGTSRGSATHKDRKFFEYLYNFCIYMAWVTFEHKNLQVIQEEIGRLLRSDTFNPDIREKNIPEERETNMPIEKKKKSYSERRTITKRPAIKSIIHQRSPVLISLLPSPKENAQYLFQYHKVHPSSSCTTSESKDWMDISSNMISSRVGIIGQPRKMFNSQTLLPLDGEDEMSSRKKSSTSYSSYSLDASYRTHTQLGLSQRSTIISRTTTEGDYSENEL